MGPLRSALLQLEPRTRVLGPYGEDLGAVIQTLGAATNVYDANGHALRVQTLYDELTRAGSLPPNLQALIDANKFPILSPTSVNVYPSPGAADVPQRGGCG